MIEGKLIEETECPSPRSLLSRREVEVMELVAEGLSNRDVANRLFITEKTVKNHLSSVFAKLGVPSRTRATVVWLTVGM